MAPIECFYGIIAATVGYLIGEIFFEEIGPYKK